jgi:hypothetical protein
MQAKELFHADGKAAGVWYCSECKIVKRTEAEAEKCCTPKECQTCGIELAKERRAWLVCERCWDCEQNKKHHERLDKAQEVDPSESVMFMVEEFSCHGDGWFHGLDEIIDYGFDEDSDCRPEFAFCSKPEQRWIALGDVLERICDDGYEDMGDNFSGLEDLQAAIDRFNELNKEQLKVYNVDYTRKVRIPWPASVAKSE